MSKTPSYLKGLAETRARAAGEVERYTRLVNEVQERLTAAQGELEACDKLIRRFDARLQPADIEPIRPWQGRYGKRGALLAAIERGVKEAHPEAISTTELGLLLQMEFDLSFVLLTERKEWLRGSVRTQLQKLAAKGLVERLHDPKAKKSEVGYWRWLAPTATLDGLAALATAAGATVTEAPEGDYLGGLS